MHGRGTQFANQGFVPQEFAMNEQEFQSKLAELMGEISTLPLTESTSSSNWPAKRASATSA